MKKEYIILTIVIVVLGAYLYFHNSDSTHYTLPQPEALNQSDITKIDISKKNMVVTLTKESDDWFVGKDMLPADKSKVTPVLKMVQELKLTALISESGNYARYELDEKEKITVTASKKDTPLRKVDIGKTASSYRHTFVKLGDNKNVYHAATNLKTLVDKSEDDFIEKSVLTFKADAAYAVKILDGDKTISLTKKMDEVKVDVKKKDPAEKPDEKPEEYWISSNGDKKEKASIEAFIKSFSLIECKSYAADVQKESLEKPVFSVTITTVNKPNTLSVYTAEKDKDLLCTSSESSFAFYLEADKLDKFKELLGKI